MRRMPRGLKAMALGLSIALALFGAAGWAVEQLMVVEKVGRIRKTKQSFGKTVREVPEGKLVTVVEKQPPWLLVEYEGVQGWMNESSVTANKSAVLSHSTAATRGATEESAAGRGFTPEVEAEYRKGKPELDAAFKFLDSIEKIQLSDETIVEFREQGKLEEGGAS